MLAAVGFFLKFKYRYDLEMNRLEAERLARLQREKRRRRHERRAGSSPPASTGRRRRSTSHAT